MENIKPYNKYKPSFIDGLGDIPEHWERWKLNRVLFFQEGPGLRTWQFKDSGVKVICVTNITPPKISFAKMTKYISVEEYEEKYKHFTVEKGNILLASSGATWGKVSTYNDDEKVILNTSTIRLNTKKNEMLSNTIVKHLLNANYVNTQLQNLLTGSCQPNFGPTHLNKLYVALPPLEEQIIIANFLDYKLSKIDRFISKKKQIIKLLNEQKAGIINHAVTKGLDPIATMKDSGIEWLGEIPEHWIVRKIGRSIKGIGSGTTPLSSNTHFYENGTINWINSGDLNDNLVYECKKQITQKAFNETSSLKKFPKGTLTVAMYGATIGKVGLLQIEATTNQACCNIPINSFYDTKFLMYWFMGNRKHIINLSYGGGQPNISQDTIKSLHIPCTSIEEQQAIVEHIEKETSKLITTIQTIEKEIALTQEYRTALIAEAVTGKIDVRAFVIPAVSVQEELYEEIEEELDMVAEDAESYENE